MYFKVGVGRFSNSFVRKKIRKGSQNIGSVRKRINVQGNFTAFPEFPVCVAAFQIYVMISVLLGNDLAYKNKKRGKMRTGVDTAFQRG